MPEFTLLTTLLVIWAAITVILILLVIYRAILGSHEEDQLFLDRAEAALEQNQLDTVRQINRLDPVMKLLAIASGALILIIAAVWVYRGLYGPVTY